MPIEWNIETLDRITDAVIESFEKMGVSLEIDDRLPSPPYLTRTGVESERITEKTELRLK